MKICTIQKPTEAPLKELAPQSLFEVYADLAEQYHHICIVQIEQHDFIIKALGRKDYKEIMTNLDLNDYLKEEAICEISCLYPEHFDFDNCDAGVATQLFKEILSFSFLSNDQEQERSQLMSYFREEMIQLHNQINCMISEAFPSLSFEEIENFDMMTALRYLSRAEWILQNFRGFEMLADPFTGEPWEPETVGDAKPASQEPVYQEPVTVAQPAPSAEAPVKQRPKVELPQQANDSFIPGETIEERIERLKRGEIQPKQLTPEKLRQLQRDFPEVDWAAQVNPEDFEANVDSTPMALRTPDQIYKRS